VIDIKLLVTVVEVLGRTLEVDETWTLVAGVLEPMVLDGEEVTVEAVAVDEGRTIALMTRLGAVVEAEDDWLESSSSSLDQPPQPLRDQVLVELEVVVSDDDTGARVVTDEEDKELEDVLIETGAGMAEVRNVVCAIALLVGRAGNEGWGELDPDCE